MTQKKRSKNRPPFTAKLTIMTYPTVLEKFKRTARRLGRSQADLQAEALKDVVKKYR